MSNYYDHGEMTEEQIEATQRESQEEMCKALDGLKELLLGAGEQYREVRKRLVTLESLARRLLAFDGIDAVERAKAMRELREVMAGR